MSWATLLDMVSKKIIGSDIYIIKVNYKKLEYEIFWKYFSR